MLVADSMRTATAVLVAAAALAVASPAAAQEDPTSLSDVGMGAAAGLSSIVYAPVKIAWALSGAKVAALVYVFSVGDSEVAGTVLRLSAGGDYVVTPEHLEGVQVLRFFGS